MEFTQNMQNVDDEMPVYLWDYTYHKQYARSNVTTAFLDVSNLNKLVDEIQNIAGAAINRNVKISVNTQFFNNVSTYMNTCPNNSDVTRTVDDLRNAIAAKEANGHVHALRQRELYFKWFILKNRPRVMEHAENTYGRNRILRTTNSKYSLTDPKANQMTEFRNYAASNSDPKIPGMFKPFFGRG